MKKTLLAALLVAYGIVAAAGTKKETIASPDGKVKAEITIGNQLMLNVYAGEEQILKDNVLSLQTTKGQLVLDPKLSGVKRIRIDEVIRPVVPLKFREVANKANQLSLSFKGGIGLDLRAYDNGVAYRFTINQGKGQTDVISEGLDLTLPEAFIAHISKTRGFGTSYENPYTHLSTAELKEGDEMTYLPILLESPKGTKVYST